MLYEFLEITGERAVELEEVKDYLRIAQAYTADDPLLETLIDSAIQYGEFYTSRDFQCKIWKLYIDEFEDRITIQRSPVDKLLSVEYIVDGTESTVAPTVYYLKKGYQWSEVLLQNDQSWPEDADEGIEHNIIIKFQTKAFVNAAIKNALFLHIANLYENRGDCSVENAAKESGAEVFYNQVRIDRV